MSNQSSINIYIVLDNIRSCYNVGNIIRSMDFFGFKSMIVIGSTPYPKIKDDSRPNYIINLNHKKIAKTALGAEDNVFIQYYEDVYSFYSSLSNNDILISLEQSQESVSLSNISLDQKPSSNIYLVLGSEDKGVDPYILDKSDYIVEIMKIGRKESLNVSNCAAIALFYINNKIMKEGK